MTKDAETVFTRRKFTITEYLDDVLTSLAETHYQGNVSLCLRAAIEDHRTTLQANGEAQSIIRLLTQIDHIKETQEELQHSVTELGEQISEPTQEVPTDGFLPGEELEGATGMVLHEIRMRQKPVRFADLRESVDLPLEDLQSAVGTLVDRGEVTRTDSHPPRFHTTGIWQNEEP